MSIIKAYKRIKTTIKKKICHFKRQKILTNKCLSAIIITTDMICGVRNIADITMYLKHWLAMIIRMQNIDMGKNRCTS